MRPSASLMRATLRAQLGRSHLLPPSRILVRCFTQSSSRSAQENKKKPLEQVPTAKSQANYNNNNNNNSSGDLPAFSFEGLGISRNLKIFLIVVLGIFGTIETWFWCKAIWQWWKADSKEAEVAKR